MLSRPTRSTSPTRSRCSSSATPVVQAHRPALARRYTVTSLPQCEAVQRNARPGPHGSPGKGQATSVQTGPIGALGAGGRAATSATPPRATTAAAITEGASLRITPVDLASVLGKLRPGRRKVRPDIL